MARVMPLAGCVCVCARARALVHVVRAQGKYSVTSIGVVYAIGL